jgi:hypothetical protein
MVSIVIFASGCFLPMKGSRNLESQVRDFENGIGYASTLQVNSPDMTVHIDPKTGQILSSPPVPSLDQAPQTSVQTAEKQPPAQLQEASSPVPGGGFMIDLGDRFLSPLNLTMDPEGRPLLGHQPNASGPDVSNN